MNRRATVAFLATCVAVLSTAARADPLQGGEVVEQAATVPPVLTHQATLHYPEEALAEQVHGDVLIRVHVDELGAIRDATFMSGPEVFRAEALRAARRLQFLPATQNGEPVPAMTQVHFHFAPPAHGHPEPVYTIEVEGGIEDRLDTHARQTLDAQALAQSSGEDLATTIDAIAGVSSASGTSQTSKPVIRGQVERRLLLLNDGIRHESQKWGVDHAPEIDPFSAGSISVIKGAAGVRYGPDAIGGVILIEPPPMLEDRGVAGTVQLMGASNGRLAHGALRLDVAPSPALALRVEGDLNQSSSHTTPDYVLGNTASRGFNGGFAAQYRPGITVLSLALRHFEQRTGVFYGIQNSTPEAFSAQLQTPLNADQWTVTAALDDPQQRVRHDLISARMKTPVGSLGEITATYAFQLNQREEWEQTRASVEGPQYDFVLRTHSVDLVAEHHSHLLERAGLEGGAGLSGAFQENVYQGLPLVPNHRSGTVGVYAFERLIWDRTTLEVGARYDHLARTAYLTETSYERHLRRGTLDADTCTVVDSTARCPSSHDAASLSVGGLWQLMPDTLDAKLDLSTASRFPNVDELFLNGSAPSFPVYALGTPDLRVETTWGASPTLGLRTRGLEAEVSTYANLVQRYVQFAPERTETGELAFDVTIRGAFPQYGFTPVPAVFYGADGQALIGPHGPVGVRLAGAMVRAQRLDTGEHLVGIPADSLDAALIGRGPEWGPFQEPVAEVGATVVGRQSRPPDGADFAPSPKGYALLSARLGTTVATKPADLTISLEGRNLLNTRYRDYLSLLRYYADQPGRDVRLRLGLTF